MRYTFFDSYRGFALLMMAVYHFSFDLNQFGVLHQNMNFDPFWLNFRAIIMTSFLGLVGVSFCFAHTTFKDRGFNKRLLKIAACAIIISITSYFMNPETWIFFGVLHFIFISSLLGPLLVRIPKLSFIMGIAIVIIPLFYRSFLFTPPLLILSGLYPFKPNTEDFSPIMPWLGVVGIGVFVGYVVKQNKFSWAQKEIPALSKLGRNSLLFYMTHQLILYPLAWMVSKI